MMICSSAIERVQPASHTIGAIKYIKSELVNTNQMNAHDNMTTTLCCSVIKRLWPASHTICVVREYA